VSADDLLSSLQEPILLLTCPYLIGDVLSCSDLTEFGRDDRLLSMEALNDFTLPPSGVDLELLKVDLDIASLSVELTDLFVLCRLPSVDELLLTSSLCCFGNVFVRDV
jgi:hypothetical protein